jgi:type II secretory pathway pseudopilin PulG
MTRRSHRRFGEAGESLAELIVTIAILGTAIVLITGAVGDSILASSRHRAHSTADTVARSAAEALKDRNLAWKTDGTYSISTSPPSGFTISSVTAKCWNGDSPATWAACPNGNRGLQLLTFTVSGNGSSQTLSVVKRRN